MNQAAPFLPPAPDSWPDEDVLQFMSALWQLNRRLKRDSEQYLEKYHLSLRHFFLLRTVQQGTVYPKDLSALLQIPATVLSRHIDQLVKQGFLERQIDPHDSRRTRLSVTGQGQTVMAEAIAMTRSKARERLETLDPLRRKNLLDTLQELVQTDTASPSTTNPSTTNPSTTSPSATNPTTTAPKENHE